MGIPLTIAAVAVFGNQVMGLSLGAAIVLAAALAPTDPVLVGDVGVGPPGEEDESEPSFSITGEAVSTRGSTRCSSAAAVLVIYGAKETACACGFLAALSVATALIGTRTPARERAFAAWFVVRGIGSLYYVASRSVPVS